MAESLFLDTIPRWFRKVRPKKTVEPESSAEEESSAPIQNVSELLSSVLSDIDPATQAEEEESRLDPDLALDVFGSIQSASVEEDDQPSVPPEPEVAPVTQMSAEADSEEGEKLDPELLKNVFSRPAPPPEEVSTGVPSIEPVTAQMPTTGVASEEAESPTPNVRQMTRVSAGTPSEKGVKLTDLVGQKEQEAAESQDEQPETPPGSEEAEDSLPLTIKDIFRRNVVTSPQVKALLERHGEVDTRELAKELDDFAASIGARRDSTRR